MTAYLPNRRNLIRTASLSASSLLASTALRRTDTAEKVGGGRVMLSGAFTGQADSSIDVRIVDNGGSTPAISAPVFRGVGSGTMGGVAADGTVAAQVFTVTLEDLGTVTRKAYAPFQNVTLRAKDAGADGNLITLTVDASAVVMTPTGFAVRTEMPAGTPEFIGDEFNFGAATLNVDGTIPATAPRISFGDDPQVYRAWRRYVQGRYVYGFSPALVRSVPAGARVNSVSGSRTVVIADGTTTETLTGIVTLYDCLRKIRDESALVEVDGVIVNDLLPDGQGATDLSVWTQPYIARTVRDGTPYVRDAAFSIAVDGSVPTEVLTIECASVRVPGRERWSVRGQASGALAEAITGELYSAGGYTFRIPRPAENQDPLAEATIRVEYRRPSWDGISALPGVCFENVTIGPAAVNGSTTFIYQPKPQPDCDCTDSVVRGGLNPDCIGLIPEEDIVVSDQSRIRRMQRLAEWLDGFVRSNTRTSPRAAGDSVDQDIAFAQRAAAILHDCLTRLAGGTLTWAAWQASTTYAVDTVREPVTRNGYRYAVTVAGTSGASQPTWPTTIGDTVSDGGVTWECIGKVPFAAWDDLFTVLQADALVLAGSAAVSGLANFMPYLRDYAYTVGQHVNLDAATAGGAGVWECTTAGTTAPTDNPFSTSEIYEIGDTVTDGTVVWTLRGYGDSAAGDTAIDEAYYSRYKTGADAVLAAAEIAPDFEGASGQGDGCWRDEVDETMWWAPTDERAPIFNNVFYHSARLLNGRRGDLVAETTREFAFGPRIGCPNLLQAGDEIIVTINGVNGVQTYQQGDLILAEVTRAVPLEFGGGQLGDDTLTFSVVGSVDGRREDYPLDTTAPAAYADDGLEFLITPGGIDFALGDQWTFAVEGGRFEWRKNAGSWSAPLDIDAAAPVAIGDGLSVVFSPGSAPSWVGGDTWRFEALASNGPEQLRRPTPDYFTWASSQQLVITPASPSSSDGLLIAEHTIPEGATIALEGSNDNFATTPLNTAIAWRARNIWMPVSGTYAKYRLTINTGGSIRWLYLGPLSRPSIPRGVAELGLAVRRHRLPGLARRAAMGVEVEHSALTQASVDALLADLDHAAEFDEALLGVLLGGSAPEPAIVRIAGDEIEVEDAFGYQPADAADRLLSVSLTLEAAA